MGQFRHLQAADGHEFAVYEALPDHQAKAGILVIQEVFGVNPHIRSVADGYAAEGYAVVAPAIFDRVERGVELGYDEAGMSTGIKLAFQDLKMENTLKDLQAAIDHASSLAPNGKVAVVGYCFGGLLTWLCACELDGVACASSYYGGGVAGVREKHARCPVMMHFGELDAHIPLTDVAAVREAQPDVQVFVYEGADHGFNCDARDSFDSGSAALAKQRTLGFFAEHAA